MSDENLIPNLHSLWQEQPQDSFTMTPEQLHARWKRLNRELRIRNGTVWLVCLTEIGFFAWIFVILTQPFLRFTSALVILAMAFMTGQVALEQRSRSASRQRAEASGNLSSLDFFRAELERQRDFHRGVWFWSRMAVLMPALLAWGMGAIVLLPWPDNIPGWSVAAVAVLVTPLAIHLNRKRARTYQQQIDGLGALKQDSA